MKVTDISNQIKKKLLNNWERQLLNQVEYKFGKKIITKGDASELSLSLLRQKKIKISTSTIRRLYGLLPKTKTSTSILNSLSRYIDFNSYDDFLEFQQTAFYRTLCASNNLDILHNGLSIISKNTISYDQVLFITLITNQALKLRDYEVIREIFSNENLFEAITANEDMHDLFAQSISSSVLECKYTRAPKTLALYPFFDQLFLSRFVDTENHELENYYRFIVKEKSKSELYNLSCSVLSYNALMLCQKDEARKWYNLIDFNKENSIELAGRICLLDWVLNKKDDEWLLSQFDKYQNQAHLFAIDIVSYCIKTKDVQFLKKLFNRFKTPIFSHLKLVSPAINKIYALGMECCNMFNESADETFQGDIQSNTTLSNLIKL